MVSFMFIVDFLAFISFLVILSTIRDHRRRGGLPYPPGPPRFPIIGNLLDIPREFSWLTYAQLAKKYGVFNSLLEVLFLMESVGNVMSFNVFGQVVVVLSSTKVTKDFFEKRGDIYSDRPVIPIFEMYALDLVNLFLG